MMNDNKHFVTRNTWKEHENEQDVQDDIIICSEYGSGVIVLRETGACSEDLTVKNDDMAFTLALTQLVLEE